MPAVHNPTWNSSQRTAVLIGGVVVLHMASLWALHSGLLKRAADWSSWPARVPVINTR